MNINEKIIKTLWIVCLTGQIGEGEEDIRGEVVEDRRRYVVVFLGEDIRYL